MQRKTMAAWGGALAFALAGAAHAESSTNAAAREAKGAATEATNEVRGEGEAMGMVGDKPVKNTGTLDIAGIAFGDGLNGQWVHSSGNPKLSTVLGGNYSRTSGVTGSITKFGAEAGLDYFLIGQHNEGLRVGPRVVAEVGVDTTGSNSGFGDVGVGAEGGYNFIARNGLTAGVAAGWDLLFGGSLGGNNEGDIDGHPYGKLNVGYSW